MLVSRFRTIQRKSWISSKKFSAGYPWRPSLRRKCWSRTEASQTAPTWQNLPTSIDTQWASCNYLAVFLAFQAALFQFLSVLRPPIGGGHGVDAREWQQVLDLLWSDPRSRDGCEPNEYRGGGAYWGPDVTRRVLKSHGLKLLIRSHECKEDGYEFTHNDQVWRHTLMKHVSVKHRVWRHLSLD